MPPPPPAPWRPALLAAAGLLWVPHLLPFALESLRDHDDCRETYLNYFAVMPGFLAGPMSGVSERLLMPVMLTATVVIYLLTVTVWRAVGARGRWILALLCVAGSAANALFIVSLLRA